MDRKTGQPLLIQLYLLISRNVYGNVKIISLKTDIWDFSYCRMATTQLLAPIVLCVCLAWARASLNFKVIDLVMDLVLALEMMINP